MTKLLSSALLLLAAMTSAQTISTIAGTGILGYSGDGGAATSAMLNDPRGLAVDAAGNIYVADVNNARIRKISPLGVITTFAGTGVAGYSGDGGLAVNAQLNGPQAVAIDPAGNVIIGDTQNRRIRKVDTSGMITTICGTGVEGYSGDNGPATQAMFHQVMDFAIDASGQIYFADSTGQRVRRIATNGIITTVAGTGVGGYSGDGGPAGNAQLNFPVGLTLDSSDQLYIADANNFRIRLVNTTGTISTVVGTGTSGFSGDGGSATQANINYVYGVRLDNSGHLFVADTSNNRVREVTNGVISTIAGVSTNGYSGDGGPAINATLNFPWFLTLDKSGNLLISDGMNNRVRAIALVALAPPSISANSTVNAASYAPALSANGAVSPGSIVSIFGSNFAGASVNATTVPLPTILAGASVLMNGQAVPLYYASATQINAQVPYNIPPGAMTVQVQAGSQTTSAQAANVVIASPGVFTQNASGSGPGAFLHANFTAVTSTSPAHAGETILIYCTGLGPTNPAVVSGSAAPGNPPATTTIAPTVTIGGINAPVSFSGLAPTFVGLYQINAQVPPGIGGGSPQVIVTVNGIQANIATIATQ